jgi:hypothetical protein
VYRLVAEDTVDEIIFETGQRKQRLTKAVLADHESTAGGENGATEIGESVSEPPFPFLPSVPDSTPPLLSSLTLGWQWRQRDQ